MRDQLTRNMTPGGKIIPPYFYSSLPQGGMVAVEEMVFRDKIDFPYDPCVSARRRRIEWPTVGVNVWSAIRNSSIPLPNNQTPNAATSNAASEYAKEVVDFEVARCDTRSCFGPDIGVFDEVYASNTRHWLMLRNLYWRARLQSAVWDTFHTLLQRGFINKDCLDVPCNLMEPSELAAKVHIILQMFSYPVRDSHMITQGEFPLQSFVWDYDLLW